MAKEAVEALAKRNVRDLMATARMPAAVAAADPDEAGLKEWATRLMNACGTGGTAKDGRIETQCDPQDKIMAELEKLGYEAERVDE